MQEEKYAAAEDYCSHEAQKHVPVSGNHMTIHLRLTWEGGGGGPAGAAAGAWGVNTWGGPWPG